MPVYPVGANQSPGVETSQNDFPSRATKEIEENLDPTDHLVLLVKREIEDLWESKGSLDRLEIQEFPDYLEDLETREIKGIQVCQVSGLKDHLESQE